MTATKKDDGEPITDPVIAVPRPLVKSIPPTNDAVRRDGGKPTDDKMVPEPQLEKIKENAIDHTSDEAGS